MFLIKDLKLKDYINQKGIRIKEIFCKNALTKSGISERSFSLNPYIGCEHSCIYCYATFIRKWREHKEEWGKIIEVKVNLCEQLKREIKKKRGIIYIGTIGDPYQPIELKYSLTRKAIEILKEYDFEFEILTKSHLILRDLKILKNYPKVSCEITLTTLNEKIRKLFEPKASSVKERMKTIEILIKNNISTTLFFGPILPYFSDKEEEIKKIFDFGKEVGIKEILCDSLNYFSQKLKIFLKNISFDRRAVNYYLKISKNYQEYVNNLKKRILEISKDYKIPIRVLF
ncbi:MAG: radical SAM protein [candidate division WOR-3 bacterium]|nr:radical SAM protein [candidate division WOR-3 bacterium]MCX7836753.1 radical SAM protein [candidate division WOR-3 bacterium]MDW8114386.1 radical SAM protein [candidate division WOR-3 bacterium]